MSGLATHPHSGRRKRFLSVKPHRVIRADYGVLLITDSSHASEIRNHQALFNYSTSGRVSFGVINDKESTAVAKQYDSKTLAQYACQSIKRFVSADRNESWAVYTFELIFGCVCAQIPCIRMRTLYGYNLCICTGSYICIIHD